MDKEDYNITEVFMPTYLQDILRKTDFITLIHSNVNTTPINTSNQLFVQEVKSVEVDTDEEAIDLTGNPLEVDLQGDDDIEITINSNKMPDNWTVVERMYYPLDVNIARGILNSFKPKSSNEVVAICNGKQPKKTLTLGVHRETFQRLVVHFVGCYALSQPEVSFERMSQSHARNGGSCVNVKVNVCTLYSILGFNKRRAQDQPKNVGNSAFIEGSWTERTYNISTDRELKLFLQVNAAHPDSTFHPLWQQITQIASFIELLQDDDDLHLMKISADPLKYYEIDERISDTLKKYETWNYIQKCEVINWKDLNVLKMRPQDFLEILWDLLTRLDTLESVLECFKTLFQDFTDSSIRYTVPASNHTSVGVIIKGIIDGTMAVPTLTLQATLKFLIELGLHKIRNDYMHLIKHMDETREAHFDEQWMKIVHDNGSLQVSKQSSARKSRVSFAKGSENHGYLIEQLNHIAHLHLAVEFMYVVRSCNLGANAIAQINEDICRSSCIGKTFKTLKNENVVDFDCALCSTIDQEFIQKLSAVSINVNFHTKMRHGESVTTIFHHSDAPIYPNTVYNDYDFDFQSNNGKIYFVHQAIVSV